MFQNGNIEEDKSDKCCHLNHLFTFRFNALPEVGQNRGLDLILDAHTNLVMKSSVVNSFQVKSKNCTICIVQNNLASYMFVLF